MDGFEEISEGLFWMHLAEWLMELIYVVTLRVFPRIGYTGAARVATVICDVRVSSTFSDTHNDWMTSGAKGHDKAIEIVTPPVCPIIHTKLRRWRYVMQTIGQRKYTRIVNRAVAVLSTADCSR
jgi:hypothetical protein